MTKAKKKAVTKKKVLKKKVVTKKKKTVTKKKTKTISEKELSDLVDSFEWPEDNTPSTSSEQETKTVLPSRGTFPDGFYEHKSPKPKTIPQPSIGMLLKKTGDAPVLPDLENKNPTYAGQDYFDPHALCAHPSPVLVKQQKKRSFFKTLLSFLGLGE